MSSDVTDHFVGHLDEIGVVEQISLILYTRGGEIVAAWSLANLLRAFCDHLEVIIPAKCHSAGTLLCLGADNLVMTKQATLGPIDPSVNTPLNPQLPGPQPHLVPVSVEDIIAFFEQARSALGRDSVPAAFDHLARNVHPLVIGNAYRTRSHIRMLGQRLLSKHIESQATISSILEFLCSESGSHDYTIHRREAKNQLGLPIETPSPKFYKLIKEIYDSVASDLELSAPYEPNSALGSLNELHYAHRRAVVESTRHAPDVFLSEGRLRRQTRESAPGEFTYTILDQPTFQGWRSL